MADKALLAGINDYQAISDLRGCLNDVENIERALVEEFQFDSTHIRTLTDREVTKENVQREFNRLLKGASRGDRLLFHFSGHGSHIDDKDGDENDGTDELLCLWDMDFDDDATYLLDDDLYRMTSRLPEGVNLTIVLDCCHSGTATRMLLAPDSQRGITEPGKAPLVDHESSLRRLAAQAGGSRGGVRGIDDATALMERVFSPQSGRDEEAAVLARFVLPPLHIQERLIQNGTRGSFRALARQTERSMNHVLVAGSKATQTSADAFIEGDFHGAFTFHLCKQIRRRGRQVDHQELIRDVRDALRHEQFSQVPQLEPDDVSGPFLGGHHDASAGRDDQSASADNAGSEANPGNIGEEVRTLVREEIRQLIRDEFETIRDEIRGGRRSVGAARGGPRAYVAVHGICKHRQHYSDPWWKALRKHLSRPVEIQLSNNRREVLWSHHVSSDARAVSNSRQRQEFQEEKEALIDILNERAEQQAVAALPHQRQDESPQNTPPATDRAMLGIPGLDCIDDFLKYLISDDIRKAVQDEFIDTVRPLLQSGAEIEIVSHSWGTVVAFEALHRMATEQLPGRVNNLFTVGSALSISRIRRRLRPTGGRKPNMVRRWVNLDARGDIVGGRLIGDFEVDEEFLQLHPSDCNIPRFLPISAACAHGSYFKNSNLAVNRDIFARFIEG